MNGPKTTRFRLGGADFIVLSRPTETDRWHDLTPAEREVVEGVLAGHSNAQIADRRGTSDWTVANQLSAIYRKVGVASRFELVALASGRQAQ